MTEFGKWLGKSNGKDMIADCLKEDITYDQAACVVTTYCILFSINVDTKEWDDLMAYIWEYYNCWFATYEDMDRELAKFLI